LLSIVLAIWGFSTFESRFIAATFAGVVFALAQVLILFSYRRPADGIERATWGCALINLEVFCLPQLGLRLLHAERPTIMDLAFLGIPFAAVHRASQVFMLAQVLVMLLLIYRSPGAVPAVKIGGTDSRE
jgi:hypothetical protein